MSMHMSLVGWMDRWMDRWLGWLAELPPANITPRVNFGLIAATLAVFSLVRVLVGPTDGAGEGPGFHERLRRGLTEYLMMISTLAAGLAAAYRSRDGLSPGPDAVAAEELAYAWSPGQGLPRRFSKSDSHSSMADLSAATSFYLQHMGPTSDASSETSSVASYLSLSTDDRRVDPAKALYLASLNAQIEAQQYPGHTAM